MRLSTSKLSALLATQFTLYELSVYQIYNPEFQHSQQFFLLKELLFSFQLFENGKVEEAALHAAHSPKVSNMLSFEVRACLHGGADPR